MKIVTVEELHAATEWYVATVAETPVLITKHGQPVAVLRKAQALDQTGKPLPNREAWIARLPRTDLDSTRVVSEDRDRT